MNVTTRLVQLGFLGWLTSSCCRASWLRFLFLSCIPFVRYVNHHSILVDKWTLGEPIAGLGDIDRSAAFKAYMTWVNMGVLKGDPENTVVLHI